MVYDWKKTVKKFGMAMLYVGIAGILSVYADNPYVLAVAPALHAIENFLKHRDDN